ncbi:MAG: TIM barrel protein, partial [Chloroflexota bacterium]
KNLNFHGLQIFGIEAADYGFGQMPENFESTLNWCQAQRCQFVIIPNPLQFEPTTTAQARQFVADVQQMADTAVSKNINIVVKVAHRFETTLLNTLGDAETFIEQVGRPNVKVELGTFDLQIEEQDGAGQMGRLGERIAFLRMSDSNQGAIGEGNMKLGAYLWAIQELEHNPPILLDIKRPYASPFATKGNPKTIQESLQQSRSWF